MFVIFKKFYLIQFKIFDIKTIMLIYSYIVLIVVKNVKNNNFKFIFIICFKFEFFQNTR